MSQPILYKRKVCPSIKEMRGNRMLQAMELPLPHQQSCLLPKRPHYFIGRLRRKLEEYLQKIFNSMIKFFVLDVLLRRVVAVSSDPAPDSAFAPSFFGRPSGQLP
jgi:hypothetical protein